MKHAPLISRRRFMAAASTSALAINWHDALVHTAGLMPSASINSPHRLRGLRLQTATPLGAMKRYYEDVLELSVVATGDDELTVAAGRTPVTFVRSDTSDETPWYHVAFDIPENKLFEARRWLLERTTLKQRTPGPATHPDFPDVAQFTNWDAHSVFFWDPAGNLLEYIARHTLKNASDGPFTSKDVLYASEIGLMADDMKATAHAVSEGLGLSDYLGVNDHFHPLGDHFGLVIVFPTGRPWRTGGGGTRPTAPYSTEVRIAGPDNREFTVPQYPYTFRIEADPGNQR